MPKSMVEVLALAFGCGGEASHSRGTEGGGGAGEGGRGVQAGGAGGEGGRAEEHTGGQLSVAGAGGEGGRAEEHTGGQLSVAGAAGAGSPAIEQPLTAVSTCGGFERMLRVEGPASDGGGSDSNSCPDSVLRWACAEATGRLVLQLTRLEYQCCADLAVSLVPEGDQVRLSVTDEATQDCDCICAFDVEVTLEQACEPITVLYGDAIFELPVDGTSSGAALVATTPPEDCASISDPTPDEIQAELAGQEATFTVTRDWVTRTASRIPSESEYVAVDNGPQWSLEFSEDGSAVRISGPNGEVYEGELIDGDLLRYDLGVGAFAGGELIIAPGSQGLTAELILFGSGAPVVQSWLGVLSVGS